MAEEYAYGHWSIAVTMIVVSLFFIFRFLPMRTAMQRRSGGALVAFIIALFTEMYGFPLTIYLLSSWFGIPIGFDHVSGHLLGDLITHLGLGNGWVIVMLASNLLIVAGIWMISSGWDRVYAAGEGLVTDGIYARVRHPQYTGIFVITLGFLIQWPTLVTVFLWPFVIWMYAGLARREERNVLLKHPEEYRKYMQRTPMFIPRLGAVRSGRTPATRHPTPGRGGHRES